MTSRYAHLGNATTTQHTGACDTPVLHACSTNLLQRLADRNAYGAVVADACEFNRGLSRRRASRLPFVDLTTRTTQRPAPWLYRPQCDRFKEAVDGGTHIVLRYLRHRWRLDSPPLSHRRKLAADRLWRTLQTGLSALGVSAELVPMVTKRAYAIAGLPIPPLLASSLDAALSKQGTAQHSNGSLNGTVTLSTTTANTATGNATSGRTPSSTVAGFNSKRTSGTATEPNLGDASRKAHSRTGAGGAEDEMDLGEDMSTLSDGPTSRSKLTHQEEGSSATVAVVASGGEESGQSNETGSGPCGTGGLRRPGVSQPCQDEETRTDDEVQSVQSGNGGVLSIGRTTTKVYDADPDVETEEDDDHMGDGDGDDDAELDEETDDVEWIQSGRRRSARSFTTRRSFNSSRASRALSGSSKGGRFGLSGGRLSNRHISPGRRTLNNRQKPRNLRSDPTVLMSTSTNTAGRRSARSAATASVAKTVATSGSAMRDVEKQSAESWDKFDEPGFQPNATLNSLTDRADESHRLLSDPMTSLGYASHSSPLVPGLGAPDGIPLTGEVNTRSSPAGQFVADQTRHHVTSTGLPTTVATTNSTGTVTTTSTIASTTVSINNHNNSSSSSSGIYPLSSTPQATNTTILSTKSSTMAQLLASSTSSAVATTTVTNVCGPSGPIYDYHSMIPTDLSVRDTDSHGPVQNTDWSGSTSSAAAPPAKLMKDVIGVPATSGTRSVLDYPSVPDQAPPSSRSAVVSGTSASDAFASPVGATTTVTFFVCEVCASRYRSTAGLRYHYHSQHSGYTPKNPISASASRLVVPIGEERGIGGGLRGGRPRRNKGNTVDARGGRANKSKDNDMKSYGDMVLGPLGTMRSGMGDVSTGNNTADAFKEPNAIQSSTPDPSSTFSPNYLTSVSNGANNSTTTTTNNNNRVPNESSPTRASFYRGTSYSPKHQLGTNGMLDDGMKPTGGLTSTPLTSMGLMASAFNSSSTNVPNEGSCLVELSRAMTPQRLHPSGVELTSTLNSRVTVSNSPATNNPMGPISSYHTVPWTGTDPYAPGPNSMQLGPLDNNSVVGVSGFTRLTPAQRRYERQHCPDRVNTGGRVAGNNNTGRCSNTTGPHCVYCLGDDRLNPRLGRAESLLRCYRCAQWAHFSCLRLPQHVIEAAMRYPWQCIDCKICWLCGSPEEEQHRMIFCSDCDRTFHFDCLPAPLPRIPDGSWSCDICLHEIYTVGKTVGSQSGDKFAPMPNATTDPSSTNNNSSSTSYYLLKDH